jgi:hypothetical protein
MGKWAYAKILPVYSSSLPHEASSFITGQILYIDGGLTTW